MRTIPPIKIKFYWQGTLEGLVIDKHTFMEQGYTEEESIKMLEELLELVQEDMECEEDNH